MAVHRLVDGVVENFPDEVVKPGRANTADIHARTLANGLETLENGDVFRGVVRRCHVYNVRLVTRTALCLCCFTIVAAFASPLAAAVVASQDVPVPGGTAALARALGIDPVPDRARFMSELTRLVYDTDARNPTAIAFLNALRVPLPRGKKLTLPFDDGTFDLVPVPLSAEVWGNAVFRRKVLPEELAAAIIADRAAALVCHGLDALDDETLQFFAEHSSLLSRLYERSAPMFAVFSGSLRIRANRVVPP